MKTNIFSRFILGSFILLCVGSSSSAFALDSSYTIVNNGSKYDTVHNAVANDLKGIADKSSSIAQFLTTAAEYFWKNSGGTVKMTTSVDANGRLILGCGNAPDMIAISVGACGSYIAGWQYDFPPCIIQTPWSLFSNSGGTWATSQCTQTFSAWAYYAAIYWDWRIDHYYDCYCTASGCEQCEAWEKYCPGVGDAPYPGTHVITRTGTIDLVKPTTQCDNTSVLYANNKDKCSIKVQLGGDPVPLSGDGNNNVIRNVRDTSGEPADRINKTGSGLRFETRDVTISSPGLYTISEIYARTPLNTDTGSIKFTIGGKEFTVNNIKYDYKKPYIAGLQVNTDGINFSPLGKPILGTALKYLIAIVQNDPTLVIADFRVDDFKSRVGTADTKNLSVGGVVISGATLATMNNIFEARIDTSASGTGLVIPQIQVDRPVVRYTLGGQTVAYPLTPTTDANDTTPLALGGDDFLGVKIIGALQGDGKQVITGQQDNFSKVNFTDIDAEIRKNAYNFMRNTPSGTVVSGVKYVNGDFTLTQRDIDTGKYNTLLVQGNLTIADDINIEKKQLGIIVLNPKGDNVLSLNGGNILIMPNVVRINALIFAEGGIMSTDSMGRLYPGDSAERTYALNKQIRIFGSVISRNTIGGATLAGGKYILPITGATATATFDEAMIYDLNYLRRGNKDCIQKPAGTCEYREPTIIIYDTQYTSNPPPLFAKM